MARVEDWFGEYVRSIIERIPRDNWPPGESEYWESLRGVLVRHGVTREFAYAALGAMVESPPKFLDQLVPEVLRHAREARAQSQAPAETPREREAAQDRSRDCEDCGGKSGLARRYRRLSAGSGLGDSILLYCRCAMGRWLEANHRQFASDVRKRIQDLQDHPWLWGPEYRHPPDLPPLEADSTRPETVAPF